MNDQPPPLVGGPDVLAADRVIQRALAKAPARPLSRRGRNGAGNP